MEINKGGGGYAFPPRQGFGPELAPRCAIHRCFYYALLVVNSTQLVFWVGSGMIWGVRVGVYAVGTALSRFSGVNVGVGWDFWGKLDGTP